MVKFITVLGSVKNSMKNKVTVAAMFSYVQCLVYPEAKSYGRHANLLIQNKLFCFTA